jgi:hypothetical protein
MPRPQTFAALRTVSDASGGVLVLEAREVRLRPKSLPETPLPGPQHHQRSRPGHQPGRRLWPCLQPASTLSE